MRKGKLPLAVLFAGLCVGALFGEHQSYQAGLRFQHLSNAGLKHPNPGINFSQVYVQYNF